MAFEICSGLHVNFAKSVVFPIHCTNEARELSRILKCQVGNLPSTYLGLPLGMKSNKRELWNPVLNKMQQRLGVWRNRILSKAARVTLIKSVISNLSVYYLYLFLIPSGVAKQLDKMIRKFFLNEADNKGKLHTVSWEKLSTSKKLRGLGIKDTQAMNSALLQKWHWRYAISSKVLWRSVKYGTSNGEWSTNPTTKAVGTAIWPQIYKVKEQFWQQIRYQVKSGARTLFWKQAWLSQSTLSTQFPRIYNLSMLKDGTVSDFGKQSGDQVEWNLHLRRNPRD